MPHLVTHDGEILTPNSKVERKACPFYGFAVMRKTMVDQKGNRCALITDSYTPCKMEISGQETDWDKCDYNPNLLAIFGGALGKVMVFPNEFGPEDGGWEGIRLTDWIQHIQQRD